MKQGWLIFFMICASVIAMVPRNRRAQPGEIAVPETLNKTCAPPTPCAWSIYNKKSKIVELNITNTYCVCSADTACTLDEDDPAINAYVFRCIAHDESEMSAS